MALFHLMSWEIMVRCGRMKSHGQLRVIHQETSLHKVAPERMVG